MFSDITTTMKQNTLLSSDKISLTEKKIESVLESGKNLSDNSQVVPQVYLANSMFTIVTILGTLIVAFIGNWLWTHREEFSTGVSLTDQNLSEHGRNKMNKVFSVNVVTTNIRTQDFFKVDIQASVYGYINLNDKNNEQIADFLEEEDTINLQAINNTIIPRTESSIREAIGQKKLEELNQDRDALKSKIETSLMQGLKKIGLDIDTVVISNIEENENYSPNNYLDAQVLEKRTEKIQEAIQKSRIAELNAQKVIQLQELENEQEIQTRQLNIDDEIEIEEIRLKTESLTRIKVFEKAKFTQEKEIEEERLKTEADIQVKEEEENSRVEQAKIFQAITIANGNKELQTKLATNQEAVETAEINAMKTIIEAEKDKLEAEKAKATAQEAINSAIAEEKADCRIKIAEKAAIAATHEATAITALTTAESDRYNKIPPTDAARTAQIIQTLAPSVIAQLPELAEALKPQDGVLGNSNVYTFPGGNGDGMNQLMLSTSGILFLNTLMEGKLGKMLEETMKSMQENKNGQSS